MRRLFTIFLLVLPAMIWAQEAVDDPFGNHPEVQKLEEQHRKAPDGYYFTRQEVNVRVHHDRSMDVTEVLHADFVTQKHGIIRSIPTSFWTKRDVSEAQDGSRFAMRYNEMTLDSVKVSEDYVREPHGELMDLRIGHRNILVEGPHDYQISYRLSFNEDERVDVSDLFFHSVVGTGWTCSTDTVLFCIEFDNEIPAASLAQIGVYRGQVGNEDDCAGQVLVEKSSHLIRGRCFDLVPFEAVSVYLPLPEGFFAPGPKPIWPKLAWGAALLTLLLVLYLLYFELKPNDRPTPVVTFAPSKDITPADVGSLVDGKVDDIDLLSLIPWMATEGYIVVKKGSEVAKGILINRGEKKLPDDAPEYVKNIYQGLCSSYAGFNVSSPTPFFGHMWSRAKDKLVDKYDTDFEDKPHVVELFVLALLMGLTSFFAQVTFGGFFLGFCVHMLLTAAIVVYHFLPALMREFNFRHLSVWNVLTLILVGLFLVAGALLYYWCFTFVRDCYLPFWLLYGLAIGSVVVIVFNRYLHRRSEEHTQQMSQVLGLKEFILTAEKDRLKMLLDQDERYFYRVLPYAMVFGLADKWAAQFEGLTLAGLTGFSNVDSNEVLNLLKSDDMRQFADRSEKMSRMYQPPRERTTSSSSGSSSSSSSRWSSYSSSGGSYHSSSRSSSGRYAGGGSGGGGGRSW